MKHSTIGILGWRGGLVLGLGAAALAFGCEPKSGTGPAPVFGGEGARVQGAQPLPSGVDESVLRGPCSPSAPAGATALIDDFEDGDERPFKEFQREGYWFAASDSTVGEMSPKPNAFTTELLPPEESSPQNRMAAHFRASGFTDWGVVWGTTLRWVDEGVKCPFNGSSFAGIKFRAKGTGRVRVNFGIPETIPKEYDGTCKERCYDTHSRVVILTPQWETYEVPWAQLQQWGWGTQASFDPTRLLNLQFAVDGKQLPVDVWIDDLSFIEGPSTTKAATAESGVTPTSHQAQ